MISNRLPLGAHRRLSTRTDRAAPPLEALDSRTLLAVSVHEPFAYSLGNLHGANGGSGFAAGWADLNLGNANRIPAVHDAAWGNWRGYTFLTNHAPAGNSVGPVAGKGNVALSRPLAPTAQIDFAPAAGRTLYFSALWAPSEGAWETLGFRADASNYIEVNKGTNAFKLRANIGGTIHTSTSQYRIHNGDNLLLVGKLELNPSGIQDTLSLSVFPSGRDLYVQPSEWDIVLGGLDLPDVTAQTLHLSIGDARSRIGNVVVGDSYADVLDPDGVLDLSDETFYVDTSGDDAAAGTSQQPWRTLEHAVAQLPPGATLRIADGTYTLQEPVVVPSLSTLIGQSRENTIIAASFADAPLMQFDHISGVRIENLTFDGAAKFARRAMEIRASEEIAIENIDVHSFADRGITLLETSRVQLSDVEFRNNSSFDTEDGPSLEMVGVTDATLDRISIFEEGILIDSNGNGVGGKGIRLDGGSRLTMRNLHIEVPKRGLWNNQQAPAIAIEFFPRYSAPIEDVEIAHSYFNNNLSFIYTNFVTPGVTSVRLHHNHIQPHGYALEIAADNMLVENNLIEGGTRGIAVWGGTTTHTTVRRNIFAGLNGELLRGSFNHFAFEHNLVSAVPPGKALFLTAPFGDVSIRNNIFINPSAGSYGLNTGSTGVSHNLFSGVTPTGSGAITADPQLAQSGEKPFPYYAIASGSPARDAGAVIAGVNDSHHGPAPDIGPWEHGTPYWSVGALPVVTPPSAEDAFGYPAGALDGRDGGAGWAGLWTTNANQLVVFDKSWATWNGYTSPAGAGGGGIRSIDSTPSSAARLLDQVRIDPTTDSTTYFSFLVRPQSGGGSAAGVTFGNGVTTGFNQISIAKNDVNSFVLRARSATANPSGVISTLSNNTDYLFVGKIVTTAAGADTVFLSAFPGGTDVSAEPASWQTSVTNTLSFSAPLDRVNMRVDQINTMGQIRFGTSYGAVLAQAVEAEDVPLAQDDLYYPIGSAAGADGGAGWEDPWTGTQGQMTVSEKTWANWTGYRSDPAPAGTGSAFHAAGTGSAAAYRTATALAVGPAADDTTYFSFLLRPQSGSGSVASFTLGNDSGAAFNQISITKNDVNTFVLRARSASSNPSGTIATLSNNTDYLFVGKIVTTAAGADSVFLSAFPAGSDVSFEPANWDASVTNTLDFAIPLNSVTIAADDENLFGRVAFGKTYASIIRP